jgi:nucleoside-diphosphate-sugar epimerase
LWLVVQRSANPADDPDASPATLESRSPPLEASGAIIQICCPCTKAAQGGWRKTMKVLITGNMGYVGPMVVRHLRDTFPEAELIGYDSGLFAHCLTTVEGLPETRLSRQVFGDVRDMPAALLDGVDAVVHLAALSNDPMGNRFEAPTDAINFRASVQIAEMAHAAGVKNFMFASSCSVYGFAEGGPRKESDRLNPLTAYARSKIATERALEQADLGDMVVTCLRFATACGMSDRLRLDLVLNDFVAGALATGEVSVLSDGSPWRPLIDVRDMARAIEWAIQRPRSLGGQYLSVNAGSNTWNYQVADLARAVAAEIPGTRVSINKDAPPDKRSYQVDFSLYRSLAPAHQPQVALQDSVRGIRDGLTAIGFSDLNFRTSQAIRLRVLDRHLSEGRLSADIRWQRGPVVKVPSRAA